MNIDEALSKLGGIRAARQTLWPHKGHVFKLPRPIYWLDGARVTPGTIITVAMQQERKRNGIEWPTG